MSERYLASATGPYPSLWQGVSMLLPANAALGQSVTKSRAWPRHWLSTRNWDDVANVAAVPVILADLVATSLWRDGAGIITGPRNELLGRQPRSIAACQASPCRSLLASVGRHH